MDYRRIARRFASAMHQAVTENTLGYPTVQRLLLQGRPTRILEVGPGSGAFADMLVRTGVDVVGVEPCDIFRDQCQRRGIPCFARFSDLPHHDGSADRAFYDAAVANFVFCTLPTRRDITALGRRIRAVLRPGASLVLMQSNYPAAAMASAGHGSCSGTDASSAPRDGGNITKHNGRAPQAGLDFVSFRIPPIQGTPSPGQRVRVILHADSPLVITDHYWPEYESALLPAGFRLEQVVGPMPEPDDPFPWRDERRVSPFLIHRFIAT